MKGNSRHRFEIVEALQVTLTDAIPQLIIANPLPEGTLCGMIYINRGRIRIGIVDPLPGGVTQGLIFRAGDSFFLSSIQTLSEVQVFKDGTKSESDHGDSPKDEECKIAEVCILYLKASPVPV